jgi:nucleoside-diphosphate-sugar epimerase
MPRVCHQNEGCAESVQDEREHAGSPVFGAGRGAPECGGELEEVAGVGVRANASGERFLATAGHSLRVVEIARILRDRLGERAAKVPARELPVWFARALSTVNPELRLLRHQLGRDLDATSAKAERLLGWRARPIEDTIADTAEILLAQGVVKRPARN